MFNCQNGFCFFNWRLSQGGLAEVSPLHFCVPTVRKRDAVQVAVNEPSNLLVGQQQQLGFPLVHLTLHSVVTPLYVRCRTLMGTFSAVSFSLI